MKILIVDKSPVQYYKSDELTDQPILTAYKAYIFIKRTIRPEEAKPGRYGVGRIVR